MRVSMPFPGNARVSVFGGCSMRLAIKVLAGILGLVVATGAWAQGTGRSLDIQPGGRQNGMGAAGVALADDPTAATWWNPAALGFVGRTGVELTYAQLVPGLANDVNYNYLTFVHPLQGWGAFGVGVAFLNEDKADPLGRNLKVGASWEPVSSKSYAVVLASDFNQSLVTDNFRTYNGGIELRYADQVAGRFGYYSDPLGEIEDITYGIGVQFKGFTVDWGSIPQAKNSDLGNVQKITIGY